MQNGSVTYVYFYSVNICIMKAQWLIIIDIIIILINYNFKKIQNSSS